MYIFIYGFRSAGNIHAVVSGASEICRICFPAHQKYTTEHAFNQTRTAHIILCCAASHAGLYPVRSVLCCAASHAGLCPVRSGVCRSVYFTVTFTAVDSFPA